MYLIAASLTTIEADALILPFTVSSENVNRFARLVLFADSFATRLNLAAHVTDPSKPLTFGLEVHAQRFALLTVAWIVTPPPKAPTLDVFARTVTGLVTALAGVRARPARPKATTAPAIRPLSVLRPAPRVRA